MKSLLCSLYLLSAALSYGQLLPRTVKQINPSLFINNMDNERVYQQANIRENLVVFSRGFENRSIEEIQQSFHYSFLDTKNHEWILELRFDRHDLPLNNDSFSNPKIGSNDFGVKIYNKVDDRWKDVTLETLPDNFLNQIAEKLPELQKGSLGIYFYNQVPEKNVQFEYNKMRLYFKQNGKVVLSLLWKQNAFIWKK